MTSTSGESGAKTEGMRKYWLAAGLITCLALAGCAAKKQPAPVTPAPVRSQIPPPTAETIEHCVVLPQENANPVTCSCEAVNTRIDSKTGHTTLVCKKMKEE